MNTVSIQTNIPQSLSRFIKSFWYLEVSDFSHSAYEEEIIPDGHHEIIFHLDNLQAKRKNENGDWLNEPNAFLASQNLKSYKLQLQPGARIYGIRFYPHTLSIFLSFPVADLTDKIIPLRDVAGTSSFWNCIAASPQKTFSDFEKLLSEKISPGDFPGGERASYVNFAVAEILRRGGSVTIEHLKKTVGVSGKYLDELFKRQVGITPKTLCQIIKLNNFIAYKNDNPEKTFTECAYEIDYYDQSHLIKAFHKFINRSPKNYFSVASQINEVFTTL